MILWKRHLVSSDIYCKEDDSFITYDYKFNEACTFKGLTTNETHPYFQPTSRYTHPFNVSTVIVEESKIPELTNEFCNAFANLTVLHFEYTTLKRIQNGALSACTKLEEVVLFNNELTEVSSNLFINNPEVIYISFSRNYLQFVNVKIFEPTKKLVRIDLDDNFLVHFNFRSMPVLQHLKVFFITNNNLLDMDEYAVLEKFPNLTKIVVYGNLLECENLKMMFEVFNNTNATVSNLLKKCYRYLIF